jgi:hypothetical protein
VSTASFLLRPASCCRRGGRGGGAAASEEERLPAQALKIIARVFSCNRRQKQAVRRLWRIVLHRGGEGRESVDIAQEARKYVLWLTKEFICQDVCH